MDRLSRLALEARDGDEASLAEFVRAAQADVRRLAALLVDPDAADDVTQEVFLRAIPALGRYRGDAPARTWILTICRRTCADVIRRRGRERRLWQRLVTQPDPARAAGVASGPGAVDLDELVATLDDDRRAAFVLTQVFGLDYAQAAAVCDVPVGTIRSRVARARGQLVELLAPGETEGEAAS